MEVFRSLDEVPSDFGPTAVAIGKFDGIHTGHRAVLATLRATAAERDLAPVVVTFDRNPLALLRPELCPDPLVSNAQKVEMLEESGISATLMLPFDRALSEMPAIEFVESVLVGALRARVVLAGSDFRFGARGAGDVVLLREVAARHGVEVVVVGDVVREDADSERRASSTWIRELLSEGRVGEAGVLLGRRPSIRSTVVHGAQRGRELGFPTANLSPQIEGFVPADGVYAAWAWIDGERYPAAVSIGNNPTFDGIPEHQVEAHLLDTALDAYGQTIELVIVERIRPMKRFASVDALVAQLTADAETIRAILAADRG